MQCHLSHFAIVWSMKNLVWLSDVICLLLERVGSTLPAAQGFYKSTRSRVDFKTGRCGHTGLRGCLAPMAGQALPACAHVEGTKAFVSPKLLSQGVAPAPHSVSKISSAAAACLLPHRKFTSAPETTHAAPTRPHYHDQARPEESHPLNNLPSNLGAP